MHSMIVKYFLPNTLPGNCTTGEITLADSTEDTILSTMNVTLEICINNDWGAVCNDDLFGVSDVQVACQQVGGYEREIVGDIDSVSIMGPVFLSELGCDGNEDSILVIAVLEMSVLLDTLLLLHLEVSFGK